MVRLIWNSVLFFFSALFYASSVFGQVSYPSPVGHVNDFANVINADEERDLENKLRDYKNRTSIEIAVVTVESTFGLEAPQYAFNLFQKWGIGDKDKNNGILVLVAPTERDMKIEVGYGMEPDLTDAQAGRIINNVIIPRFKSGQMQDGIVAGVNAVVSELGETPFQARLEERKLAEQRKLVENQRRSEELRALMVFFGIGLAFLAVIGTPIVLVYLSARKRRRLQLQFETISGMLSTLEKLIKQAENQYSETEQLLVKLQGISPGPVWQSFARTVPAIPADIKLAIKEIADLRELHNKNGWGRSSETYKSVLVLLPSVEKLSSWRDTIEKKISEVIKAKNDSPVLLKTVLSEIEIDKKHLEHNDISDGARQCLKDAEDKCKEANSLMASQGLLDWLSIYGLIKTASSLVTRAVKVADSDKRSAEEARRPKPVYRPSSRSSSRSSGGSRSGGFGGFGGGRSGGGGARGRW